MAPTGRTTATASTAVTGPPTSNPARPIPAVKSRSHTMVPYRLLAARATVPRAPRLLGRGLRGEMFRDNWRTWQFWHWWWRDRVPLAAKILTAVALVALLLVG